VGRANDVCLQCHLQGDVTVPLGASSPLDFEAGQRLLDRRQDFLIDGEPELLGVASHGARMLQSRCFTASEGKLTCIHCHDPHRPASDFSVGEYDRKCLACHASEDCNRETDRAESGGCVQCHMARRPTREGLHLVFTDHAMLRRPHPLAQQPSLLAADSEVELISAWPNENPGPAALGAAYVLLHETMGPQAPSLRRGRELLSAAVAADPQDVQSRYWLGSALVALGRAQEARQELERVVREQPEWHEARYRLGLADEAAHDAAAAIVHYQHLLADVPSWIEPAIRLAQLELSAQRPAEAARVLRHVVQVAPSATAYASLALAERLAGASHEAALALVDCAIKLDSREAGAYVTRGTLYLLVGSVAPARADFERALMLDPGNASARQAHDALRDAAR
jgi:tetratricopeptide (TPR) repeat protein